MEEGQLGLPASLLPSHLPFAVLETMRNFGLSCRTVTSRGDLATCPAGEYRSPFPGSHYCSQYPGTPSPKSRLYFLSQLPQSPGLQPQASPLPPPPPHLRGCISSGHRSPGPQPPASLPPTPLVLGLPASRQTLRPIASRSGPNSLRSRPQASPSPPALVAPPVARGTCAPRPHVTASARAWTGPELAAAACRPPPEVPRGAGRGA